MAGSGEKLASEEHFGLLTVVVDPRWRGHGYNDGVKTLVLLFGLVALLPAQDRPGNFDIRLEPTAMLQTGADIPFQITVRDALRKPLVDAKVTLQVETAQHDHVQVYKAPAVDRGVYLAKPVFSQAGAWNLTVQVHRADQESSRTIEVNVPRSAE